MNDENNNTTDLPQEIAFGLSRRLPDFKRVVPQAQNYDDLGLDPYLPEFPSQLLDLMNDASRIHFDLSGMRCLNTPDGVLSGPVQYNPLGSTNWELRTIWDTSAFYSKTIFYRDGVVLTKEEIALLN